MLAARAPLAISLLRSSLTQIFPHFPAQFVLEILDFLEYQRALGAPFEIVALDLCVAHVPRM